MERILELELRSLGLEYVMAELMILLIIPVQDLGIFIDVLVAKITIS